MEYLFLLMASASEATTSEGGSSSSTTDSLMKALKDMVKSPIFYVVIGLLVLLIVGLYLYRRIVKARANAVTIVVRGGQIYKVIDHETPKYFMVPFKDVVGAVIPLNEQEFSSDKLFINNGPDALYKVHYTIKYKVETPTLFFKFVNKFQDLAVTKINDDLREYADNGNALVIVKDYREHNKDLLALLSKSLDGFGVDVVSFKINFIEPLGRK